MKKLLLLFGLIVTLYSHLYSADYKWVSKGDYYEMNQSVPKVLDMVYTQDSLYFYTFSSDNYIRKWEVNSGYLMSKYLVTDTAIKHNQYQIMTDSVSFFNFSKDAKTFCTCISEENNLVLVCSLVVFKVYNLDTHSLIASRNIFPSYFYNILQSSEIFQIGHLNIKSMNYTSDSENFIANISAECKGANGGNDVKVNNGWLLLLTRYNDTLINKLNISDLYINNFLTVDSNIYYTAGYYQWQGNNSQWVYEDNEFNKYNISQNTLTTFIKYNYSYEKYVDPYGYNNFTTTSGSIIPFYELVYSKNRNILYINVDSLKDSIYYYNDYNKAIWYYNLNTNKVEKQINLNYNPTNMIMTNNEKYIAYKVANKILFFNPDTQDSITVTQGDSDETVSMFKLSRDNSNLIAVYNDTTLRITNINSSLKVNENSQTNNDINIYPNPTINEININLNNDLDNNISIYNVIGEKLYEVNSQNRIVTINTSMLSNGIYNLKIVNSKYTQNKTFIVNK